MGDGNAVGAVLLGLGGFRVLSALEEDGELFVLIETARVVVGCPECGGRARVKERPVVEVRDVAAGGRPCGWYGGSAAGCVPTPTALGVRGGRRARRSARGRS